MIGHDHISVELNASRLNNSHPIVNEFIPFGDLEKR